jgi:hypothetical protein
LVQVFHILDVDIGREYLLKKIQYTDVIDAITEIKKEMYNMCEKEKISL